MAEILEQLQVAALYHATRGDAETVFSVCDVADFEPGYQQEIASIITAQMNDGEVTAMSVLAEAAKRGKALVTWFTTMVSEQHYSTASYCAQKVREAANRRRVEATLTRALQALTVSQQPVETVLGDLVSSLEVDEAHLSSGLGTIGFDELMETAEEARPWIMPGMLRTNERMILTGPEGGGKSVFIAQVCLGAAMGLNTLSIGTDTHPPMRVLMLDVENDRLQIKANMRKVYPYMLELSGGVRPDIEWVDVRDIDLSDPVERQKIIRLAKERQPQLLYMGSLYKLAPEGDKVDAAFTAVSRTVDRIRAETGASVLIEAHAGHSQGLSKDRNGMRPYGSSMWLRWPEFGIGMVKHKPSGNMRLKEWRGMRSDDRDWPAGLRRGGVIPWVPITKDEWAALYGDDE